ncbi:hypothetical protein FQN50_009575 [Emmonsiellopsis sp. PD_5]|nr:hypothetical protein FQN50_009575 [Emmonsiellopsis sp. PD_5]
MEFSTEEPATNVMSRAKKCKMEKTHKTSAQPAEPITKGHASAWPSESNDNERASTLPAEPIDEEHTSSALPAEPINEEHTSALPAEAIGEEHTSALPAEAIGEEHTSALPAEAIDDIPSNPCPEFYSEMSGINMFTDFVTPSNENPQDPRCKEDNEDDQKLIPLQSKGSDLEKCFKGLQLKNAQFWCQMGDNEGIMLPINWNYSLLDATVHMKVPYSGNDHWGWVEFDKCDIEKFAYFDHVVAQEKPKKRNAKSSQPKAGYFGIYFHTKGGTSYDVDHLFEYYDNESKSLLSFSQHLCKKSNLPSSRQPSPTLFSDSPSPQFVNDDEPAGNSLPPPALSPVASHTKQIYGSHANWQCAQQADHLRRSWKWVEGKVDNPYVRQEPYKWWSQMQEDFSSCTPKAE